MEAICINFLAPMLAAVSLQCVSYNIARESFAEPTWAIPTSNEHRTPSQGMSLLRLNKPNDIFHVFVGGWEDPLAPLVTR